MAKVGVNQLQPTVCSERFNGCVGGNGPLPNSSMRSVQVSYIWN